MENSGVKKNDKGKGKEVESGRKRKRVEEDDEDEYDRVEMQESGRAFVLAQIIKMDEILDDSRAKITPPKHIQTITTVMPPWPTIISTYQRWLDGPTEADENSQEEDGSDEDNISEDKGNEKDDNEDNDSKQEHTKDNAPAASATSVNCMFVFFFISLFS